MINALSVIEWAPPLPVPIDIRLVNDDPKLLKYAYDLAVKVPPGFTSLAFSVMAP